MRSSPNELAEGVRALLKASVAPEISSPQARIDLRKALAVLRAGSWNEMPFMLLSENRLLLGLLAEIEPASADLGAPFAAARDLAREALTPRSTDSYPAADALNQACRSALGAFVDAIDRDASPAFRRDWRNRIIATLLASPFNAARD